MHVIHASTRRQAGYLHPDPATALSICVIVVRAEERRRQLPDTPFTSGQNTAIGAVIRDVRRDRLTRDQAVARLHAIARGGAA